MGIIEWLGVSILFLIGCKLLDTALDDEDNEDDWIGD